MCTTWRGCPLRLLLPKATFLWLNFILILYGSLFRSTIWFYNRNVLLDAENIIVSVPTFQHERFHAWTIVCTWCISWPVGMGWKVIKSRKLSFADESMDSDRAISGYHLWTVNLNWFQVGFRLRSNMIQVRTISHKPIGAKHWKHALRKKQEKGRCAWAAD